MSELAFIHRTVSTKTEEVSPSLLVWKTCRRQILFFDANKFEIKDIHETDQIFSGTEAEIFLAEVLCGLQSPLVGETEVFGQFKSWWKSLPATLWWKQLHHQRIEALFSLVKKIREEVLYNLGSRTYGSILRRHLLTGQSIDLIGAGQLVEELLPWIEKNPYRIWCRTPGKINFSHKADQVFELSSVSHLNSAIVVAAPLTHDELRIWLARREMSSQHTLFDLRADSFGFDPGTAVKKHFTLQDFSTLKDSFHVDVQKIYARSRDLIFNWNVQQQSKSQIRPFGWDDL